MSAPVSESLPREAEAELRRQARALVERARERGGSAALRDVAPLAFSATLIPTFDPESDETLLARSVELTPIVNPLFDALMLSIGARRSGLRSYRMPAGRRSRRALQALFEAVPEAVLVARTTIEAYSGNVPYISGQIRRLGLWSTLNAAPAWHEIPPVDRPTFWIDSSHDEPLKSSVVVLSTNGRTIYIKVCSQPNEFLGAQSALRFYAGGPDLNLYRAGDRHEPLRVTPATAVANIEAAAGRGYVVTGDAGFARLHTRVANAVIAEKVPGAPGEVRLLRGRSARISAAGFEAYGPPSGSTLLHTVVSAAEANTALASARAASVAIDDHVEDICRMIAAVPAGREGLYPFQDEAVSLQLATRYGFLNCTAPGLGKGHPVDTNVLTPLGWRRVGDLVPGDEVIGSDGKATTVTGVFPKGELPVYRVGFSDGSSVRCDEDHLWSVREKGQRTNGEPRAWKTMEVRELRERLRYPDGTRRWRIPMTEPVEFAQTSERPIDAYVLGVLLGDGALTLPNVCYCSDDPEIAAEIERVLPSGMSVRHAPQKDRTDMYYLSGKPGRPNPVRQALESLRLTGEDSIEKFIPREYLFGSIEDRVALLQGLMDTDGSVSSADNHLEFSSSSLKLAEGVKFIVQSLGGTARIRTRQTSYTHLGEKREGQPHHRVSIQLPESIRPFRLPRKADVYRPRQKYPPMRVIDSITPDGVADVVCISVAADDHLYLTEECLVTHNTVMTLRGFAEEAQTITGFRALVVVKAAVRTQWVRECARFFPEAHAVALHARNAEATLEAFEAEAGDEPGVLVVSFDSLRRIVDLLAERYWHNLVCDEAAVLASPGTARTRALWQLRAVSARALALTGTPIDRSLDTLGRILAWIRGDEEMFHGMRLSQRFNVLTDEGREALWRALFPLIFRRDRSEVNDQLPQVETEVILLDPSPAELALANGARRELRRIYDELCALIERGRELDPDDPALASAASELASARGAVLGGVTYARMAACDPHTVAASQARGRSLLDAAGLIAPAIRQRGTKRTEVVDLCVELVDAGEAVLIATDYASAARNLCEDLLSRGIRAATYLGGQTDAQRMRKQDGYQGIPCPAHEDSAVACRDCALCIQPEIDVLIFTKSAREGMNLQRCSVQIQFDLPWVPSELIQRIGRAARLGSPNEKLRVIVPIMAGTIEERVAAIVISRAVIALQALDATRGVNVAETEMGLAIAGLDAAVSVEEREAAGNNGAFEILDEIFAPSIA